MIGREKEMLLSSKHQLKKLEYCFLDIIIEEALFYLNNN